MKVLVTGASGFLGSTLVPRLGDAGLEVVRLVRSRGEVDETSALWDPESGEVEPGALEGADAVVHLAGENIAGGRWTRARKERIRSSRVAGTSKLCATLASLERKPGVLLSASAIGYYGSRGDEVLDETSAAGTGFLAEVTKGWEEATRAASDAGIRVVLLRFGVILGRGGALAKMLPPFRFGLGGRLGDGRQYMSWVHIEDAASAIEHGIRNEPVCGPVNIVSPNPVTNAEFTAALGKVLGRPTLFPVPARAVRLIFGELADEMLLASARVRPRKLEEAGFRFQHPGLEAALRGVLGK